jgi:hypothetical protein
LAGLNFVAIPAAQVALAAAQKKLRDVQANHNAGFGDIIGAQLLVSEANPVIVEVELECVS